MRVVLLVLCLVFPVFAQLPNSLGNHSAAVLLVNFQDKTTQPWTITGAQQILTSSNNWFIENSFGQMSLSGDVYGYYTLPMSYTICDRFLLASHARNAAQAAGVNLANYQYTFYVYPKNACAWSGLGTFGGYELWSNGIFDLQQVIHEHGHNIGLAHSRRLDCGTSLTCTSGTINEYGDPFCAMASGKGQYNIRQKERAGWINTNITTVPFGVYGDFTFGPYETEGAGLKLDRGDGSFLYLEHRIPYGVDSYLGASPAFYDSVLNGVLLRLTRLGQLTPYLLKPPSGSWSQPGLMAGQTVNDFARITVTSVSDAATTVNIGPPGSSPPIPADSTPPSVTITQPQGTIKNRTPYTIEVIASDNVGIHRVRISTNGNIHCIDYAAPYSCGPITITAKRKTVITLGAEAFDPTGNIGSTSTQVTVR